jgi:hypothetical protein
VWLAPKGMIMGSDGVVERDKRNAVVCFLFSIDLEWDQKWL